MSKRGKDGDLAPLENATRFPLSHSLGDGSYLPPACNKVRSSYYDPCGNRGQVRTNLFLCCLPARIARELGVSVSTVYQAAQSRSKIPSE